MCESLEVGNATVLNINSGYTWTLELTVDTSGETMTRECDRYENPRGIVDQKDFIEIQIGDTTGSDVPSVPEIVVYHC